MKTFTLSKKDLAYLQPLDATMTGLNIAIQSYVISVVYKRLEIDSNAKGRYDLDKGEIYVLEPKDEMKTGPKTPVVPKTEETKK